MKGQAGDRAAAVSFSTQRIASKRGLSTLREERLQDWIDKLDGVGEENKSDSQRGDGGMREIPDALF